MTKAVKIHQDMTKGELLDLGAHKVNAYPIVPRGYALYLFPARVYKRIPYGLTVLSVMGRHVVHTEAKPLDNDERAGFLAYGLVRQN